jgi:uncharacterized protein
VRIEFDEAKDKTNRAAHGVSLALAESLDWDAALVWIDDRFEYEELRAVALAPATSVLYYVAFCRSWTRATHHQLAPSHPP